MKSQTENKSWISGTSDSARVGISYNVYRFQIDSVIQSYVEEKNKKEWKEIIIMTIELVWNECEQVKRHSILYE